MVDQPAPFLVSPSTSYAVPLLLHYQEDLPSPVMTPSAEALAWTSNVLSHDLNLEHGAVGIDADRVVYYLELSLATPLPAAADDRTQYLSLSWPFGGLWQINSVSDDRRTVECESWRRTTMTRADLAKEIEAFEAAGDDIGPLFEWKMVRGAWGRDADHWSLRAVAQPPRGEHKPLVAVLFVGFAPLETHLHVHAITAVDTVAQTFNADATWQVTLPAITAIREDSVLRELLDVLELDAEAFEFSNIRSMEDERALATSVQVAGEIQWQSDSATELVYDLQYSRRVVATFSQEMALHHFPFDRQTLTFEFSSGRTGLPAKTPLRLAPTPVNPGRFAVAHFRLGNVFDVVCHDKVFVRDTHHHHDDQHHQSLAFALLLERKSGYYLTNVALIAACITYLSFITWAPVGDDNELMDMGARLQIVLTLLLTAVTFKNQVASLLPQVSYFTTLDKYVFFCFLVTCAVTLENALFPLWAQLLVRLGVGSGSQWKENSLLGLSCGAFTVVNVAWAVYLKRWVTRRRVAIDHLLQVNALIRVITDQFPAAARDKVLQAFLTERGMNDEATRPHVLVTSDGDLHVQLPDDSPSAEPHILHAVQAHTQRALTEESALQKIYANLYPGEATPVPSSVLVHAPSSRKARHEASLHLTPAHHRSVV